MRPSRIAIPLVAVLLAALVIRVALVEANAGKDPAKAAAAWPGHPSAILASGLGEIGSAASRGQPVSRRLVSQLISAASKAPLAPEPFLVRGVDATLHGQLDIAGSAFVAARNRDPRSVAARYFLADHYLRTSQTRLGLNEISVLTRLVPGSLAGVGPYLAAFARQPGARSEVQSMIRRNPDLETVVLNALAANAGDAPIAVELWNGRAGSELRPWQSTLIDTLVSAGRYGEAHQDWIRFTGQKPDNVSNQPDFAQAGLGHFGWSLVSGASGVAEAAAGGSLHIIYYGREDLTLASKVMMLRPGPYRLSMRINATSSSASSLVWTIKCLPSGGEIVRSNLAAGNVQSRFEIPTGECAAQRIELGAAAQEVPEQVQLTINDFRIEQEGRR